MKRVLPAVLFAVAISGTRVQGQPVLPGIACRTDSGGVALSWICQYEGVRAVAVKRSYDSMRNYSEIGLAGSTAKGPQWFTDVRPLAGKSYYKVTVTFNSGLNWSSNHCSVVHDGRPALATEQQAAAAEGEMQAELRPRVILSRPETDLEEEQFVLPIHVRPNRTSGHVDVYLPADYGSRTYSLVFFNARKQAILDVPVVRARASIIDRRNFQRSGTYKFVLRRDGVVYEAGYIKLEM